MNPRICICCGEAISTNIRGLSRNPNLCASCSSMADGVEQGEADRQRLHGGRVDAGDGDLGRRLRLKPSGGNPVASNSGEEGEPQQFNDSIL